jgi:hypothetical protein
MNVGIGSVAAQFLSWEYLLRIFGIVSLQCTRERERKKTFSRTALESGTILFEFPPFAINPSRREDVVGISNPVSLNSFTVPRGGGEPNPSLIQPR